MNTRPAPGVPTAANEALPLSAAQSAIASAQQALGPSHLYWTAQRLELKGPALPSLAAALEILLSACTTLHYSPLLAPRGWLQRRRDEPVQLRPLHLTCAEQAQEHCQEQLKQAFSPGDSLYRCHIISLPGETWVYLQVHHLAFDGFSYSLFWQALCARLENPNLPPPAWDIAPIVQQDLALRQTASHSQQVHALRARLPAPVPWQTHNPLADLTTPALIQGRRLPLAAVQMAAARLKLSWPQWLACACAWVLHQLGWTHERALGLVNMARRGPQARVPMMCMGLQALHCPAAVNLEAFLPQFLQELAAWQPCPQVRQEELTPPGFSQPLGACVNLLLFPQALQLANRKVHVTTLAQGPVQLLNLNVQVDGPELALQAALPSHWQLFGATQVLDALARLLIDPTENLTAPPPNLVLGPPAGAPIDLLGRLWQQKSRTPNAPAYCTLDGEITSYRSLYRQMVSLSEQLSARAVGSGERVALWAEPGLASLVAYLAISFSRASYLPLDPHSNPDRLRAQLSAAGVKWLLAPQRAMNTMAQVLEHAPHLQLMNLDELLGAPESLTPCKAPPSWVPQDEAYVLFTSGSSGEPKGVVMSWGAYGQFLAAAQQAYQPPLAARWLQFAALSFDASLEEIGLCLSHGGCLYERPEPCDFASLNALIAQHQINVLDLPTAYWHQWVASAPPPHPSLKLTIIGGEALCPERLAAFRQLPGLGRLINSYGPTETCIVASAQDLTGQPIQTAESIHAAELIHTPEPASLGRPLAGMGALILDAQRQPLPAGSIGELFLFGSQLAEGYLDPVQTRQRFVAPTPAWHLPSGLYASGDLARLNEQGALEFIGRNDDEIKLDGLRIDLQKLTRAHLAEPAIAQAALWLERSTCPPRVMAALVLRPGLYLDTQAFKARLATHWPGAAVPSRYLILDQLPLNSRGKTDWTALATRAATQLPSPQAPELPLDLRQQLKQLWHNCLGAPPAPSDDFWQAGGRSLTALVLAQNISTLIGCAFPAQRLYTNPRFEALCQQVEQILANRHDCLTAGNLCLYPGSPGAEKPPTVYACAPIDGGVEVYRPLGPTCGLPLWGLPSEALGAEQPTSAPFDAWVQSQCQWLLARPGPLILMGWSSGGSLALALAAAITREGRTPNAVLLLDAYPPQCWQAQPLPNRREALLNLIDVPEGFDPNPLGEEQLKHWLTRPGGSYARLAPDALEPLIAATLAQMRHFRSWRFAPYPGPVHYLAAALTAGPVPHQQALLDAVSGPIQWSSLHATHLSMLASEHIPVIATLLNRLAMERHGDN